MRNVTTGALGSLGIAAIILFFKDVFVKFLKAIGIVE